MSKSDIFEKLTGIFQDVFDDGDITISETTTAAEIDGWDSLTHITTWAIGSTILTSPGTASCPWTSGPLGRSSATDTGMWTFSSWRRTARTWSW